MTSSAAGAPPERPGSADRPIWIDLDNAPHVVTFSPIIHEFERRGRRVLLTARAVNNTPELARRFGLSPRVSGRPFGKSFFSKALGTVLHSLNLARMVRRDRPALAVSHGSRSQGLAAALLRVPVVLFFDYEGADLRIFQKVARRVYFPEAIAAEADRWPGPPEAKRGYPGFKEHLALLTREGDAPALAAAGVPVGEAYAVIRPESDTAHYLEGIDDSVLVAAIRKCQSWRFTPVVAPRSASQRERLTPIVHPMGRVVVLQSQVNGMDLLAGARLLISGGGTMNREAVVLGVPCISMFRGRVGLIDRTFLDQGKMVHAPTAGAIENLAAPPPRPATVDATAAATQLRDWIVERLEQDLRDLTR